jgi:nucleotide-binding universal stress UspA family protein
MVYEYNDNEFAFLKIMVPTSGAVPAQENAEYVLKIAKRMNANVLVVHIRDEGESREGDLALDIYDKISKDVGVNVRLIPAIGEVSQTIIELAKFEDVDLIVMGATEGRNVASWIIEKIINKTDIPVVIIPWRYDKHLYKETITDAPFRKPKS